MEEMTRKCKKCGEVKPFKDFVNNINSKYGIEWTCKTCRNNRLKKWRTDFPEKKKLSDKNWAKNNREKKLRTGKEYREKNKQNRKKYDLEYRQKNKEKCYIQGKNWRTKNKEKVYDYHRKYSKENREKIRANHRGWQNNNKDKNFKIKVILRSRLNSALKSQNAKRTGKTIKLLGCSINFLISHLESKFKEGMTWSNHSLKGWHIDHIKPCAKFDLTDPIQQKQCFHYTNLQPLWALENIIKRDKFDEE